jgi:hypothetical protein
MGRAIKKPPAPMETRWATVALAAIDFLAELDTESLVHEGCYASPHVWSHVADTTTNLVHDMAKDITRLSLDPRIQIACQFEAELHTNFYRRCLNWNKVRCASSSPPPPPLPPPLLFIISFSHTPNTERKQPGASPPVQVGGHAGRGGAAPCWWEAAAANPENKFPSTFARIRKMRESNRVFGSVGGNSPTSSADMADLCVKKITAGIAAGMKEFEKNVLLLARGPHPPVPPSFQKASPSGSTICSRGPWVRS